MKIEVGGTPIAFESTGQGPAVLFLHAFPLPSAMWAEQVAVFSSRHQVITVDARGFGGSGAAAGSLTMNQIASDAVAVLDHLNVRRTVVAGCSMGGYAAFAFARHFADRLSALVLIDTRAAADSDEARTGRSTLAGKVEAQGAAAVVDAMLPKIVGATSHGERPEVVSRVRQWMLDARPEAIVSALQGLGSRPDARTALGGIGVPTLIVRGAEDTIISEADVAEMHQGIPGSRTVTLGQAGHLPNLETPQAFDAALAGFLAGP
jgi:3-oxoadipate enol-lactonase